MSRATVVPAVVTQSGSAQRVTPQPIITTGVVLPARFVDDSDQTITPDPIDNEGG